jgi:GNAT superfamily N-acetyltransferase
LPEEPARDYAEARQFCLDTIMEFYGFGYRHDWHADLDSLLLPWVENHYSRHHAGAFWTLRDTVGDVVATAGIRHLAWKPNIVAMFPQRYARGEEIASLWRVYVRKDRRGHGLGRWLTELCEKEAVRLGYGTLYLHASSDAPATLGFWQAVGYRFVGTCETSTHFDKQIGTVAIGHSPELT